MTRKPRLPRPDESTRIVPEDVDQDFLMRLHYDPNMKDEEITEPWMESYRMMSRSFRMPIPTDTIGPALAENIKLQLEVRDKINRRENNVKN